MHQSHERISNDFSFHPATDLTVEVHDAVRQKFASVAHWIVDNVPRGYAREYAVVRLRESMMWTNAAIACDTNNIANDDLAGDTPTQ
jgi:hypothetical protein